MLTIFQATFHLYRKYCCSEITKPFLTDTGNKMALIKIRLNLLCGHFFLWKCDKCRRKKIIGLKSSSVLVRLTAGRLPELHMFRIRDNRVSAIS